jgi:hypothetical protein
MRPIALDPPSACPTIQVPNVDSDGNNACASDLLVVVQIVMMQHDAHAPPPTVAHSESI